MALDPSIVYAMHQILDAIAAARSEIEIARDEGADPDEIQAAHDAATAVFQEYEALLSPLTTDERVEVKAAVADHLADLKSELRRLG